MKKSVMSSNERNEYLLSYGSTNEDITEMYKKSNVLTGLKKETIKRKLDVLMNFGISKKDIIDNFKDKTQFDNWLRTKIKNGVIKKIHKA